MKSLSNTTLILRALYQGDAKQSILCLLLTLSATWLSGQSFSTNGSASYLGGLCYQTTPDAPGQTGSIFSSNAINLNEPFTFFAKMNFGVRDLDGADGFVFILTPNPGSLGAGGGGIGYSGITPSIAVEFDTYYNDITFDPTEDHMAIISNGNVVHSPPTNLSGPIVLPNLETGQDYCFTITWNPTTQTLTAGLNGYYLSYTGNIINSIFSGNPVVHFGYSSATGAYYNHHVICVVPNAPAIMPDVTICQGESVQLEADPFALSYSWQPDPSLSNLNISNPVADPVNTTTYIVGTSYFCYGYAYDTITVTVNPDLSANASNTGPECEYENITLNAWGGESYNWSGPLGFSSDQSNPVLFGVTSGHAGTYFVTITDDNGCTSVASTIVNVNPNPVVNIVDPGQPFCETGDAVQITATPAGGQWDGPIGTNGLFNPAIAGVGVHTIGYYYSDGNNCSASTEIEITVVPNTPATITPPGPFCQETNMVTLSANPSGGMWGGVANNSGQIFPSSLSIGMHPVTYALTTSSACYDTEIQIEIVAPTTLIIPEVPDFCEDDPDYQLTGFEPAGGIWSGASGPTGIVEPQVLGPGSYLVTYTYTPPVCPVVSGSATFSVFGSPAVQNIERICDDLATTYIVQFEITGGDPSGYNVDGSVTGSIVPGDPAVFTSDPIPTGNSYTFSIYDDNHCDTIIVAGSFSCNCITSMGSMNQAPLIACEGESITVSAATGYTLDPNDALIYVLHTGNPFEYIVIGNGTTFTFEPPLETGVTYFVDALIGNSGGNDGVDLTDPCLAITPGPTLMWQANPTGSFSAPTDICTGDAAVLTFTMSGVGPFDITYLENNTDYTITNLGSSYSITVYPEFNTSYTFLSLTDLGGNGCSAEIDITIDMAVNDAIEIDAAITICQGESIFLEGAYQDSPGTYQDIIPGIIGCDTFVTTVLSVADGVIIYENLTTCHPEDVGVFEYLYATQYGCDSVIIETISLLAVDTTYQYETTCDPAETGTFEEVTVGSDGCDNLNIVFVTLIESDTTFLTGLTCDPQEIGTHIQSYNAGNGCDSIVITTLSLTTVDTTHIAGTSCIAQEVGVFTDTHAGQNGCDSTVITTITYSDGDTMYLNNFTCDEQQVGLFTNTYTAQNGCDSIVITNITLSSPDTSYITGTTCDAQQAGVFTNTHTGQNGCDSTVISTFILTTSDTSYISGTTCDIQQVGVITNTYTGQNGCDSIVISTFTLTTVDTSHISGTTCDVQQVGVFSNTYTAQNGCDSIVISTITLTTVDTSHISGTTCDEQQVGVFTNTYTAQNGCDSIVISSITLTTVDTSHISGTTCDEQQVGVFINTYTAQNGCDSIVISTTILTTPETSYITGTTCNQQQVGVFSNTYTAQNGCDSIVISTITLTTPDTSYISDVTCDEQQAGVFTDVYIGQNGCDSLVVETITYSPVSTLFIQEASCMSEDTGTVITTYQTTDGCDSVIIIHTQWLAQDTVLLTQGTCAISDTGTTIQLLENRNGCDSIIVIVISLLPEEECGENKPDHEVFIPNTFSPNGDGINDYFYVMAETGELSGIESMRIYNRWGGLITEKKNGQPNDPSFGWDGSQNGEVLNPGVFTWQVHLIFTNGVEKMLWGDVTLMR